MIDNIRIKGDSFELNDILYPVAFDGLFSQYRDVFGNLDTELDLDLILTEPYLELLQLDINRVFTVKLYSGNNIHTFTDQVITLKEPNRICFLNFSYIKESNYTVENKFDKITKEEK